MISQALILFQYEEVEKCQGDICQAVLNELPEYGLEQASMPPEQNRRHEAGHLADVADLVHVVDGHLDGSGSQRNVAACVS